MRGSRKLKQWGALFLLVMLVCLLLKCVGDDRELMVYCARSLQKPMEEVESVFEREFGVGLNIIYAGTFTLVEVIKETRRGDILIPGNVADVDTIRDLVLDQRYIASHSLIVVISKSGSQSVETFRDLAKPGVKIGIGDESKCTVGRAGCRIIQKSSLKGQLMKNIFVKTPTAPELLDLLGKGLVDAVITYDDLLSWPEYRDFTGVEIPPDVGEVHEVDVIILKTVKDRKAAFLFADFMEEKGKEVFQKWGFEVR